MLVLAAPSPRPTEMPTPGRPMEIPPPLLLSSLEAEALAVAVGRRVRVLVRVWEILEVDAEAVIIVELPLGS